MTSWRTSIAAIGLLVAGVASALPAAGTPFPKLAAQDAAGARHSSLVPPGETTLVVAITERGAEQGMRAWFDAADDKMSPDVHRVSIISLRLPFFVGIDTVRSRVRSKAPQIYWKDTFVDKNGAMAKALKLPSSDAPFAFAVAADGTVKAAAHGPPTGAEAEAVFRALQP